MYNYYTLLFSSLATGLEPALTVPLTRGRLKTTGKYCNV